MIIGDLIDLISLPSEDAGWNPQTVEMASPMLIYDMIIIAKDSVVHRNEEARRQRGQSLDRYFLKCIAIKKVDKNECACNPASKCIWYRTVDPLPDYYGDGIEFSFTKSDFKLQYTQWDDLAQNKDSYSPFLREESWTKRRHPQGEHAYFEFPETWNIKYISAEAAFRDIAKMLEYNKCQDGSEEKICNMLEEDIHIDQEYVLDVVTTVQSLLSNFLGLSPVHDINTDQVDDSKQISDA